jgi:hypothetical protein
MVRALVAALLCALAAAVASGCGTEDVGIEPIAEAAEATSTAGGSRFVASGKSTVQGQTFELTGEGRTDAKGNSEMEMELPGGLGTMKQVLYDWVMYQQLPGMEQQLGAEWAKVDLREAYRRIGVDIELFLPPGGNDPKQWLEQMRKTSDEVEKLGTEKVRGVETTHYKADLEMRKAVDHVPAARRAEAERAVDKIVEISGTEGFPMEVWIDDDKLIRRMRMDFEMNNPAFGGELDMDMTMELFDYGAPVSIEAPDDDEVRDLTDIVAEQLR